MNKGILILGIAACLPLTALAQNQNQAPGYNYVEGSLVGFDAEGLDLLGFGLAGSYEFTDSVFARVSLNSLSDEVNNQDVDYSDWAIGAGYIFYQEMNTNAYAGAELVGGEIESGAISVDGDGYALFAGLRSQISTKLELNGEVNFAEIEDDNQTSVKGGLVYALQNNLGVSANLSSTEGDMGWGIGLRYQF